MPQISFRCDEDFRRQFGSKARGMGLTAQAVLEAMAVKWLEGEQDAALAAITAPTASHPHGDEILAALGATFAKHPSLMNYVAGETGLPVAWLEALAPKQGHRKAK